MTQANDSSSAAAAQDCAGAIGRLLGGIFGTLQSWCMEVEAGIAEGADVDQLVYDLVAPELDCPDPVLIGGGFIAAPGVVKGDAGLHFAWWLGPLENNPLLGTTTEPTRLDVYSRQYADYLQDFRALEWYRVPETTGDRHITGPYVDHLCTCDYLLTLTMPVPAGDAMGGVVGGDVLIKRLEQDVLPLLRVVGAPAALVSAAGRVVVSTLPALPVGSLAPHHEAMQGTAAWTELRQFYCPGTSLKLMVEHAEKA